MRKVDKLLIRAILPPFLSALVVLTFVVFVQELGHLSELLVTRNASLDTIAIIGGALLPSILIFSLPLAYLIGILIGLSGLSSESQITALRACGIPLRTILRPILMLGALVGVLTAVLSLVILPESNDIVYVLKDRISLRQATSQIQARVFNENFSNIVFYLDDLTTDRQRWSRVFLVDNSDPKSPRTVLAREGTWLTDSDANRLQLHLQHGTIYEVDPQDPGKDKLSLFAATDIPVEFSRGQGNSPGDADLRLRHRKAFELSTPELWRGDPAVPADEQLEQRIELHRRLAIPFSVFGFSLLGLTLGVSTRKGGRTSGFVLSLVLVLVFYVLFMNGLRLASVGKLSPWAGAWGANILLACFGILLLSTAERGNRLSRWVSSWQWKDRIEPTIRRWHLAAAQRRIQKIDDAIISSTSRITRLSFPRILDIYVSRGFVAYFLWSTIACVALFVILTLFDLLDDIIRNRIAVGYVLNYFFFLTPQILMLVIPIAVLLAVLINFGILEKTSEVTALKAGGWSLYRISVPVFLITAGFCVSLYFIQDYILPYANIRQDSLHNYIKGKPAQTSMRPRKWIFGESHRVFNYDYFDPSQNLFIGLNVFEIDFRDLKILKRIHADRAEIEESGHWKLKQGWERDFRVGRQGFRRFTEADFDFPEKASYFQREMLEPKESAKLTYLELKEYINYLKQSGYNATELQVELYKKITFPLSCVVMALVGVPFSFFMGKKGAFFGIAISITIAISYWGVFSVFEKLGAYGFLVPLLAAWAPNVLFGAAGLVLLFTIRT